LTEKKERKNYSAKKGKHYRSGQGSVEEGEDVKLKIMMSTAP